MLNKVKEKMGITMATNMIEKVATKVFEKGELYQEVELPFNEPDVSDARDNEELIMAVIMGVYNKLSKKALYHGIRIIVEDVNHMIPSNIYAPILENIPEEPIRMVLHQMVNPDGSTATIEDINEYSTKLKSGRRTIIIALNAKRRNEKFRKSDFVYPVVNIKFK